MSACQASTFHPDETDSLRSSHPSPHTMVDGPQAMTVPYFWLGREAISAHRVATILSPVAVIQATVAEHFDIAFSDMKSNRRDRKVVRPRQIAMYLAKQLTGQSLPEIGRRFGNRDHTTVMYAVAQVERRCGNDPATAARVDALMEALR